MRAENNSNLRGERVSCYDPLSLSGVTASASTFCTPFENEAICRARLRSPQRLRIRLKCEGVALRTELHGPCPRRVHQLDCQTAFDQDSYPVVFGRGVQEFHTSNFRRQNTDTRGSPDWSLRRCEWQTRLWNPVLALTNATCHLTDRYRARKVIGAVIARPSSVCTHSYSVERSEVVEPPHPANTTKDSNRIDRDIGKRQGVGATSIGV
jgi:hypothetical protein